MTAARTSPVTRADLSPTCHSERGCDRPRLTYGAYCRVCDPDLPDEEPAERCVAPLRCYCSSETCRARLAKSGFSGGVGMGSTDLKTTRRLAGNVETLTTRLSAGRPPAAPSAPDTSHAASARLDGLPAGRIRVAVLEAVARAGSRGATDDDVERDTGRPHQSVSSARNALVAAGYLADSGQRRPTRSGSEAIVWRVSPAAEAIAAQLTQQARL